MHHMNIKSHNNLSQYFGMMTLIFAVVTGFILKNKITSKKFIIIYLSIAKMFLELMI